ncbi:MAG: ATP-NAD kinase [Dethiosulfovibrio peptidovorans]|nr:MAG: ATP-NAD kinase [Dethiosulfovibrio peptidovorans]
MGPRCGVCLHDGALFVVGEDEFVKIGLIVNPIAGLGGTVALKGTDGDGNSRRARELGASPMASVRASLAITTAVRESSGIPVAWMTSSGSMGGQILDSLGIVPDLSVPVDEPSSREDTLRSAAIMAERGADLLVIVGGDGTARDVCSVIGQSISVIGVPAGVKIHSGVFARTPLLAGELLGRILRGYDVEYGLSEVMDIDEKVFRAGRLDVRLFGYLSVPVEPRAMQVRKSGRHQDTAAFALDELAAAMIELMEDGALYLMGSGSTVKAVTDRLGCPGTLLGIDAVLNGETVALDMTTGDIVECMKRHQNRTHIVVSPIGGQGFLFGRGNQQFSPAVIRSVGRNRIHVIAAPSKMTELFGRPFSVDTGDLQLDRYLQGMYRVLTGYGRYLMWPIR